MFDSMLGKGFKSSKCKTLLKLAMARIKLLRNKRDIQVKQMRKDLAQLLQTKQEASARIRVEHIIREQNIMAAYDILELFCELVAVRLPIIEGQKSCPIDLKEAIASLIFASPRCADLPELLQVRSLFAAKYGKDFAAAAAELRPDSGVNRRIIEKLSVRAPPGKLKLKLMKEIAAEHNIEWDPADSENELLKAPEDLLDGPSQFVGSSQVPLPTQVKDELPSAPSKLPENSSVRQSSPSPSPSSVRGDTSEANAFPDVPQSKVPPRTKHVSPPKSKQVVEESDDETSEGGSADEEYEKELAALKAKRAQSRSRKEENEAYRSIAAAARVVEVAAERTERASRDAAARVERAAREAAERATAAARAATDLSKSGQRPAFSDFIRVETRTFDDYVPPPPQSKSRSGKSQHQRSANFGEEPREEKYGSPRNQPDQYDPDESRPRREKSMGLKVISEEQKKASRQEYYSARSAQEDSEEEEEVADPRGKHGLPPTDRQSSASPIQRDVYSPTGYELDAALTARMAKLSGRVESPSEEIEESEHSARTPQHLNREESRSSEDEDAPRIRRASKSGRGVQPNRERSFASEHPQAEEDTVPVFGRGSDPDPHPIARGSMRRDQRSPPEKQETDDIFNTVDPSSPLERSLRGKTSSGVVRYDSYNEGDESQHRNRSSKSLTKSNSSSSDGGMSSIDLFDISVREVQDHGWTTSRGPVYREQSLSRQQRLPGRDDAEATTKDLYARGSKPQPESRRPSSSDTPRGQQTRSSEEVPEAPDRTNSGEDLKPTFFAVGLPPPPGHPSRYTRSNFPSGKSVPSPVYDDAPPSVRAPIAAPTRISPTSRRSPVLSPPSSQYSSSSGPPPPQRPPPPVEVSPSFKHGSSGGSRQAPSQKPPVSEDDSDSSDDPSEGSRGSGLPDIDSIEAKFKR